MKQLILALRKYGWHLDSCATYGALSKRAKCNCGFDSIMKSLPKTEPVAWLAEEQGFFPGDGRRELWFKPNENAVLWKQTPLYAST